MGATYRAYAVLGIKLNKAELFQPKKCKAYEHNHPEHWRVDPVTGRELWTTYPVCLINNSEDIYGEIAPGIKCVSDGTDRTEYYLGLVAQDEAERYYRTTEDSFLPSWNTDNLKEKLKNLLEPHKLWFPDRFGIHAVQYCSY